MKSVFDPKYILEFIPKLVEALPVTLLMTAVAMVGGLLLGFVLAIIKIKKVPVLRQICALYVSFMRGTPLLVQLFLSYYGLPILLSVINEEKYYFYKCRKDIQYSSNTFCIFNNSKWWNKREIQKISKWIVRKTKCTDNKGDKSGIYWMWWLERGTTRLSKRQ